jgi:hypothetical protein
MIFCAMVGHVLALRPGHMVQVVEERFDAAIFGAAIGIVIEVLIRAARREHSDGDG